MGHHYLPQFYLQGFTENKKLWAHDKDKIRTFKTQPKAVANETEMYTDELEQHLANAVEDPALESIERIRRRLPLRHKDRDPLAAYIVALWKRVPSGRDRIAGHIPSLAEEIRKDVHGKLDVIANSDPDLSEKTKAKKDEVDAIIASYKASPPDYFWHHTLKTASTPRVIEALSSMRWTFLVSANEEIHNMRQPGLLLRG